MSTELERTGETMLAWIAPARHKRVPIEYRAGSLYIAKGVHRTVADFVVQAVGQLGLSERPLVIMQYRSTSRTFEAENLFGIKTYPAAAGIPATIQYPRAMGLQRSLAVKGEIGSEVREVPLIDWAFLNALLRLRFPDKSSDWIRGVAANIVVHGWDALHREIGGDAL